ncbi:MAG: VCBS repeat-containing protein [Myxococcota bacterium]
MRGARVVFVLLAAACSDYEVKPHVTPPEGDSGVLPEECALPSDPWAVPTDAACLVDPPVGTFSPVVEWQWTANPTYADYDDIMSTPSVGNLTDDNADGVIDDNDIPDIVFTSFANGGYTSAGTLTAISGDGSGTHWSIYDPGGYHIFSSGGVAIGDIDADGLPEVCTAGVEVAVVCVNADGSLKWVGGTEIYGYGAPAFADVDADGQSEVVFGRQLLDTDGTLLWTGTGGAGWWLSFAVDLDGDGRMEIIAGNTVYRGNGNLLWTDATTDGPGAVGDFDLDGTPEIVHTTAGTVVVTNIDGVVRWQTAHPGGGNGGPPTVADFDNDGLPEVGVAGAAAYTVFDTDGTVLWSMPVSDYSSTVTGSSVFDFEGDGAADVVYADELTLWVYDGATGAVKLQDDGHASGTLYEYPLIVDVDNDGSTEIVLPSNNYAYSGYNGITVIGDATNSWRPSRPVWNQFAYHITNVDDDGGIPTNEEPNWERWNNFRAGGTLYGLSTDLADLAPGAPVICDLRCDEGVVEVMVPVENTGLADTPSFNVGVYQGTTFVTGVTLSLAAGAAQHTGPFQLTQAQWDRGMVVRVDVDRVVEECDETDNSVDLGRWPCE